MPFFREKSRDFLRVGFREPADATFDQRSEVESNAQLPNAASIFAEAIREAFDCQFFSVCRAHSAKITQREFVRNNETRSLRHCESACSPERSFGIASS